MCKTWSLIEDVNLRIKKEHPIGLYGIKHEWDAL